MVNKATVLIAVLAVLVLAAEDFPLLGRNGAPESEGSDQTGAESFNRTAKEVLHPVYPYLAEAIADELGLRDRSGVGVDIGGGPGDLVLELSNLTPGFYWIDADLNPYFGEYLFQGAIDRECSDRVGFIPADVHKLPFREGYADVIVSRGSLQQWNDRIKAFREIYRVLKPGGNALIGRGFPGNMPVEAAKGVRERQGGGPRYSPGDTAAELEGIMKALDIRDYKVLRPRLDQDQVNYGVWIVFSKPAD